MRTARLIDWMVDRDLVVHLRRVEADAGPGADPLLDPRYENIVWHTMTEEERRCQVERLRRLTPLD